MSKFKFKMTLLMIMTMHVCFGCAVGQKIRYHDVSLDIKNSGTYAIAITAIDSRPYVVDGEKDTAYIGTFRGGWGNPFDVTTESGNALAKDMAMVICSSLNKKGFQATPIFLSIGDKKGDAIEKLIQSKADRLVLLTINEWYSSTYQNTGLNYDVDLVVMNGNTDVLAKSNVKGEDDLGGSTWNPPAHAKAAVPEAYKKKLESLMNSNSVVDALK